MTTIEPQQAEKVGRLPGVAQKRQHRPNYQHIHRNVFPVKTHPLPTLIPHNPLSVLAIALTYLVQVLAPPQRPTYNGYFSSATASIHITDHETQRALWEMGFFGRGSLSRSEPTWLETQKRSTGTAELHTAKRRTDRRLQKLDRARKEQKEISEQLSKEQPTLSPAAQTRANDHDLNSIADVLTTSSSIPDPPTLADLEARVPPKSVPENSSSNSNAVAEAVANGIPPTSTIEGYDEWKNAVDANGLPTPPPTSTSSENSQTETSDRPIKRLQRQKTVRFSPTIEAREFDLTSPVVSPLKAPGVSTREEAIEEQPLSTENKEHLQISLEEAFFLSYGLGVLNVFCDDGDQVLSSPSLLSLFRRHSYCPPRSLSVSAAPDDPFMLSYAAYHHYRSMGWVVRSGVKFGVDYLLYNRGPAFSHAEFAVVVMPAYDEEHWNETDGKPRALQGKERKTWWWLHGVNRVQAQVQKSLILCYVDVPPPAQKVNVQSNIDIEDIFKLYSIRDVTLRRWTPNRSRD